MHKIVLAGCGGMANEWMKYALERKDCEVVALVDIMRDNALKFKLNYNLSCSVYDDLSEAVNNSGANLVFDVTIPSSHKQIVSTALQAGCNVMGEKPMAASMEEAGYLVSIANKSGKQYSIMQNRRYLKNIRAYRHLLNSGAIGTPGFVSADFFLGPHFGGFRDIMDSPLILDMAIHTFDQARFIIDADPVSVYCHEFNPTGSWYKGNACAICIFEMSDGTVFNYRGSWCAEGCQTSWESFWRVMGDKGTAIWDGFQHPYFEVPVQKEEKVFVNEFERKETGFEWHGREGHFGCLDEMFQALLEGRKAETDCSDNIKSMAMVFGAIESAKKGCRVQLKNWY
jgi:predicted dehydrogenase